uniref:Nuclear pore complex protein NUP1-like isoform X2 n=1 Tax=Tanacetum cinerariifolium TaxID=118510 RepID=A0A699H0Y0_TANCI|nr:nuclear pore complex protein NUP1-like isoform X2 [Tanacetum cinerariifolium]
MKFEEELAEKFGGSGSSINVTDTFEETDKPESNDQIVLDIRKKYEKKVSAHQGNQDDDKDIVVPRAGERENFHVVISTPVINSRAFKDDVASPAELAKAYMGASTRPAKVSPSTLRHGNQAPRQDSVLLNNTTILPRTPITSLAPRTAGNLKGVKNGMTTLRSRDRSTIYSMARSPCYRGPSTLRKKASKRRSFVLDDLDLVKMGRPPSVIQAMYMFLPSLLKMASGGGALVGAGVGTDDSMMVDKLSKEINDMKIKVD